MKTVSHTAGIRDDIRASALRSPRRCGCAGVRLFFLAAILALGSTLNAQDDRRTAYGLSSSQSGALSEVLARLA